MWHWRYLRGASPCYCYYERRARFQSKKKAHVTGTFTVPQWWAGRNVKRVEMRRLIPNIPIKACNTALTGLLFRLWRRKKKLWNPQCAFYSLLMRDYKQSGSISETGRYDINTDRSLSAFSCLVSPDETGWNSAYMWLLMHFDFSPMANDLRGVYTREYFQLDSNLLKCTGRAEITTPSSFRFRRPEICTHMVLQKIIDGSEVLVTTLLNKTEKEKNLI